MVCDALQKLGLVVCNGDVYKEDSSSSSKGMHAEASAEAPLPQNVPACPPEKLLSQENDGTDGGLTELRKLFPQDRIAERTLRQLAARLYADYPDLFDPVDPAPFIDAVAARQARGKPIRFGALLSKDPDGFVPEYFAERRRQLEQHQRLTADRKRADEAFRRTLCPDCQASGIVGVPWSTIPEAQAAIARGAIYCACAHGTTTRLLLNPDQTLEAGA